MENSKIEWTTHTFNPWHGCMKVSDGCKFCYAETLDNRWKGGHWGPGSSRKKMSDKYWAKPFKWDSDAAKTGHKAKVFCASMADVFEGHPNTIEYLHKLFWVISQTPNLIWQLLTKRPENIMELVPLSWHVEWPDNVWIGTSVENQAMADLRIPHLIKVPAKVRFLSCEPLLGAIDLTRIPAPIDPEVPEDKYFFNSLDAGYYYEDENGSPVDGPYRERIEWVIVGGESGSKSRPMHPDWVRNIRDQCKAAEVPFFFKQWGEWYPYYDRDVDNPDWRYIPKDRPQIRHMNLDGGSGFHGKRVIFFIKKAKNKNGAILDGEEYSEYPKLIS